MATLRVLVRTNGHVQTASLAFTFINPCVWMTKAKKEGVKMERKYVLVVKIV